MGSQCFYRIVQAGDGLVDVLLTPGEEEPLRRELPAWSDYNVRVLAVRGVVPTDPQWCGDLEEHIRRHYESWLDSAEEIDL